jgi:hypothetical protein
MLEGVCRFCDTKLAHTFVNLGITPLSNAFVSPSRLQAMEPFYPLQAYVCDSCFLVQLEEFETPKQIFNETYAYYSSYSASWLKHVKDYVDRVVDLFHYGKESLVIEVGSNDGYLLQYFHDKKIPVLGIEPALNVAQVAMAKGIPTRVAFFGTETAKTLVEENLKADLVIGNNVLAHVPKLNDFVHGLGMALKDTGVITMEFPHLLRLLEECQFDTIYHEHFSYLSLLTVQDVFARHGLRIFDVEELSTHGGSLRIYACHSEDPSKPTTDRVSALLAQEQKAGLRNLATYRSFQARTEAIKRDLLEFMINEKRKNKTIIAYGAAAKGNTLLNYCGVRKDFVSACVDRNPYKQGKFLPGSRIPVYSPDVVAQLKPDYILILPWNFRDEIMSQMSYIRDWGGKFVVPIPEVRVYS